MYLAIVIIKNYSDIYKSICIGDKYNSEMIVDHHYDLLDHVIINQILSSKIVACLRL